MRDGDLDELQRIWELKEKGAISDEEYGRLKAQILGEGQAPKGDPASEARAPQSTPIPGTTVVDASRPGPSFKKIAGIGCLGFVALVIVLAVIGSNTNQNRSSTNNSSASPPETNLSTLNTNATSNQEGEATESNWSYSEDEDKIRGGTTYYAYTTSTNSVAQEAPYDSDTTMRMTVRKSPAYGTDVILTISSGQMMCPSFEGCSGTVRFDNGPAQHIQFNGPADDSSDTVFVVGAKQFIAKLKSAKKVTIEKTLYQAGNPQFEFDVHGLKWNH